MICWLLVHIICLTFAHHGCVGVDDYESLTLEVATVVLSLLVPLMYCQRGSTAQNPS